MPLDGKRTYSAEWKLYRKARTPSQNKLYWMWLNVIATDTGNDKDTLHDYYRAKYLPTRPLRGMDGNMPISTTELNTAQFSAYMEQIQADSAIMGIILPNPDDLGFEQMEDRYG